MDDEFLGVQSDLNLVTRIEATIAFIFFGLFFTLIALVQVVFSMGREGHGPIIYRAAVCHLIASFCGMLSMGIFARIVTLLNSTSGFEEFHFTPGYSFALEVG